MEALQGTCTCTWHTHMHMHMHMHMDSLAVLCDVLIPCSCLQLYTDLPTFTSPSDPTSHRVLGKSPWLASYSDSQLDTLNANVLAARQLVKQAKKERRRASKLMHAVERYYDDEPR